MIKKRLIAELGESRKYIAGNVAVQWVGMLSNAVMIFSKLLRLGSGYREKVSTSEVVQVSVEGVDQLETYFGQYLPQFFYAMLAPVTLFVMLSFVSLNSAIVLLICVPLIPAAIVAVQKIAKKLLNKYWGQYTKLGDTFLENLQGLTTLKIYQADEYKNQQMNEESEKFRKITMKVLTMQLNSVTNRLRRSGAGRYTRGGAVQAGRYRAGGLFLDNHALGGFFYTYAQTGQLFPRRDERHGGERQDVRDARPARA